jgi:holliday junction DNA helicase RuvA
MGVIALLTGEIANITNDIAILDVGGVGYAVTLTQRTANTLPIDGSRIRLHIHTHVREDQLALFGFQTPEERTLFLRLLSVSGIGPRMAMAILSGLPPHDLVQVVSGEDVVQLTAIPGVGKKTAERIILDLRDRLLKDHASLLSSVPGHAIKDGISQEALSALVNLGYPHPQALDALRRVPKTETLGATIKDALKLLAQS